MKPITIQQNILTAAKNEFLEKGFRGALLRNIVKTANVTIGAFYGCYKSKEDLFDALIGEQAGLKNQHEGISGCARRYVQRGG